MSWHILLAGWAAVSDPTGGEKVIEPKEPTEPKGPKEPKTTKPNPKFAAKDMGKQYGKKERVHIAKAAVQGEFGAKKFIKP